MISSRLNQRDGWLSVWREDRDPAIVSDEAARQFHEYILKSGVAAPEMAGIRPATKEDAATISRILDDSFGEAMTGVYSGSS